ncbi:CLUMA_CG021025, isoform A [Clunio marinus]|uniref:CLUMA_CG021025, isoform A n=1 Tax=Clunio marinus TaxID=568069 RepID=A0A1J1J668_9DIPT|nr:CLUMA_CG021025, isoform A [Clunio marinus]
MWCKFDTSSFENETIGNSFAINGIIKISNEEHSKRNPKINAQSQSNRTLIAVDKSLILLDNESESKFFSFESEIDCFAVSKSDDIKCIKKIFNLENYIIGLNDDGQLIEICPFTKTIYKIRNKWNDAPIEDMRMLEANDEYIELLVLSAITSQNERLMKIVEFPSMNIKSELTIPGMSWLVTQQKSSVNLYFIAGIVNEDNYIQTIEIRNITETDPEDRYNKLLLRGHFEQAEEHAKEFELSLEPLHEARVRRSLNILKGVKSSSELFSKEFDKLMSHLSLIENKEFLVSIRLNEIPNRSSMTVFLTFLLNNIDTNEFQSPTNEINELLLRLETLRLIDPDECNMQWEKFLYNADMGRVAMDHFKSDVSLSCIIWSRHASSIMPRLNIKQFKQWLENLPSTVEPFAIIQWLRNFAPCFLQLYSHEMTYLVDWCLKRTHELQFSNSWPEVGLEFINNINGIFKDVKFLFIDIRRAYHQNMEKIQAFVFKLEEMLVLKQSYHLTMSLDEYSKGSIEDTAFRLLQRIQMQNFTRLVNDFLYPIFVEHGSTPEDTIVKYIQFLCTNKSLGYWQERAILSIDLLHNEENRLQSALLVLKVSPVPWSKVVLPLAALGTSSSHPLAKSIYIEYKTQAIKIIKVKYGWPIDYFDLQQDRVKLVFRILKINNPEMIEDVEVLINSSPGVTHEAYFHLIHRLVELGKMDEFNKLIMKITENVDRYDELFESISNSFTSNIDDDQESFRKKNEEEMDHTMEAIKVLFNQLKGKLEDTKISSFEMRLKNLRNIIKVRRLFNIELKLKHLKSKVELEKKFEEGISIIVEEVHKKSSLNGIWCKIDLLGATFNKSRFIGCQKVAWRLNNIYVTCHIVDTLNSSMNEIESKDIESVMEFAILMLSQQIEYFENNIGTSFLYYDPLVFPLAYEFLKKCLIHNDLLFHNSLIEVLSWLSTGRNYYPIDVIETTKKQRILDERIFENSSTTSSAMKLNGKDNHRRESFSIFETIEDKIISTPTQHTTNEHLNPVLRSISNCLRLILFVVKTKKEPFNRFHKYLQNSPNNDIQQIKDNFFGSLEALLKSEQHQPVVKLIHHVVERQKEENVSIIPPMFATTIRKKILKYMLSQKNPEYLRAFRILQADENSEECMNYLRSVLKNSSQKIAFSTFSEMYNKYVGNVGGGADERQNRLKFYYYSELCKYDPNLRFKTNFDSFDINELLQYLENHVLNIELVKKLTKDFGWDYQKVLVQQIKIILQKESLEFELKANVFGKEEVIVKTSVESIRKKLGPYLNDVTNHQLLLIELNSFIREINYYFYEMYLVVFEMIEHCGQLTREQQIQRHILFLLKHKLTEKRRGVDQRESDWWLKLHFNSSGPLPAISKYRLPFKPIMEEALENILNEDLNVDSFEKLIPLIKLHASHANVDPEERVNACAFTAVKNSVLNSKVQFEVNNGAEWNLKPKNNAFLQTILRMVSLLKDKPKQLAILYFYVNHAPNGSDKVEAAYECWKFACCNEDQLKGSKFYDLVEKIKRKYPQLKTQHLLNLYGLSCDDKVMQLIENPRELIQALYQHESILGPQKKEISKLCDEISRLHDIDLLSLQCLLLHKWLAFSNANSNNLSFEEGAHDANETLYEDFINSPTNVDETEFISDENVVRAYYILSSWNGEEAMDFLASELGSSKTSSENQLQLYETFAKLIDDKNEAYMDLVNTDQYLHIKCCHLLKQLGFQMKPEVFKDTDKLKLLKKVWVSHFNNIKGLEVMSFICLGFNIHLAQIWNGILKQMVSLKMVQQLSILVEILSTKSQLLHLSSLKSAWECVIKDPLLHATKVRSYEQNVKLSKALILLQRCPVSTFLCLEEFIELLLRLDRPHMAAIFIAFAAEKDRSVFVKMFESFSKHDLRKNIIELEEFGIAPVITQSVLNILQLNN